MTDIEKRVLLDFELKLFDYFLPLFKTLVDYENTQYILFRRKEIDDLFAFSKLVHSMHVEGSFLETKAFYHCLQIF